MNNAIGIIEFNSIARGINAWDAMMKAATVNMVVSAPVCPGKYVIIISGDVGAVETSVKTGREMAGRFWINSTVIPNIHPEVIPAMSATVEVPEIQSLGVIETYSIVSAITSADAAVKAATVKLIEIRIARGLGGKGFVFLTGDVGAVQSAVKAAIEGATQEDLIAETVVIPYPHHTIRERLWS
ncbi:MAG: BMC domain-containing protein [Candidatus Eremiobacterota bacterium]